MTKSLVVLVACLALIGAIPSPISAQESKKGDWKFEAVSISSGDSPIASGITASVDLVRGRFGVQAAFQHEQAWLIAGRKLGKMDSEKTATSYDGFIGLSAGHFQGAPWGGPYLTLNKPLSKHVSVSTLQWPGFFAWSPRGRDGRPLNVEWAKIGYVMVYQITAGPVGVFYSGLNYLDDPWNDLPGVSVTHNLRKDFSLSASATWNSNKSEWMFLVGAVWKPHSS
ncbi:MAG: hypothetical protein AAB463_01875 [Patescibacteria group bacterium]